MSLRQTMPDREKVIKGLETIKQFFGYGLPSTAEMFDSYYGILNDAIALLREQKAVEPEVDVLNETDRLYRCPKCHKHFFYRKQKYCDQCGQAVKWE